MSTRKTHNVANTTSTGCSLCSSFGRCWTHELELRRTRAELTPARVVEAPAGARALLQPRNDSKYNYAVDPDSRALVPAAAATTQQGHPLSAEALRKCMGGTKAPTAPRLDTQWDVLANDSRGRAVAMKAAGWLAVTVHGGHPRFERTLMEGVLHGTRQVLCFSSTPSIFSGHKQAGDLARADRKARGER